jgi:uncharacterized DUF497 family protein
MGPLLYLYLPRKAEKYEARYSAEERRYAALGQTIAGQRLSIVFTIRGRLVRIISARNMSRRERRLYERAQQAS